MTAIQLTDIEERARQRVCLALDVPTVDDALDLIDEVGPYIGFAKIGKQLHTAAGMGSVNIVDGVSRRMGRGEASVFLDLKFHDTPNTVKQAAYEASVREVYMMDVHIAGGESMCKAALEGAQDAARYGIKPPKVIGVTVLTSLDDTDLRVQGIDMPYDELVMNRARLAQQWGLDGIVCPASKAGAMEGELGPWLYVTPGVKFAGEQGSGQKQLYTPARAVQDCRTSILVVGSAITKAENKAVTAHAILQSMTSYV
jgi:orotidine-5'-phosphate decarboxylase